MSNTYYEQACEKLDSEIKGAKLSQKGNAVKSSVIAVLKMMCKQEEEFAQAIVQTDKTAVSCIEKTVAGCGQSVSDIEVYKRAAAFYFPGAKVHMILALDLVGDSSKPDITVTSESVHEPAAPKKRSLEFDFDELF